MDNSQAVGSNTFEALSVKLEPVFVFLIPVIFSAAYFQLAALKVL